MRHSIAQDANRYSGHDGNPPLSPNGMKRAEEEALGMKRLGVKPQLILSSSLRRAWQTAEIVAAEMNKTPGGEPAIEIETCDELLPNSSPHQVFRSLENYANYESVLLVGHQPLLGMLAGNLITGSNNPHLAFDKGSVCLIEVDDLVHPGRGDLMWFLTPQQLAFVGSQTEVST